MSTLEQLRDDINAWQLQIATLTAQREALQADLAQSAENLAAANAEIERLTAEIERLQAIIAAGGTDPDRRMLIGATIQPEPGETWETATAAFEQRLGKPIQIARRFLPGAPTTWAAERELTVDEGKRASVVSFKGTPGRSQIVDFLHSFPDDDFDRWVAHWHEPDKNNGRIPPATHQRYSETLREAIEEVKNPRIHGIAIVTSWGDRDNSAATTSLAYMPTDDPGWWTFGIDPYDPQGKRTVAEITMPTISIWRDHVGDEHAKWMVTETGTKRTGADAADWYARGIRHCRAERATAFMPFHARNGDNGPWWINDPEVYAALAAEM